MRRGKRRQRNLPSTWNAGTDRMASRTSASVASKLSFPVRWRTSSICIAWSSTRCWIELAHFVRHARLTHRCLDAGHLFLVIPSHFLDRDLAAVDFDALRLREAADVGAEIDTPEDEYDAERDQDRNREYALQLVVDRLEHVLAGAAKNGALG